MRILYNSRQRVFKTPFGAVRQEEPCKIEIHIPRRCAAMGVSLIMETDAGEYRRFPMSFFALDEKGYDCYTVTFSLSECGLYFYYFEIEEPNNHYFLYRYGAEDTNIGEGEKWQLTCYAESYHAPKGFAGSVMYQIFPDRFYREELCDTAQKLTPFVLHSDTAELPHYLPDEKGVVQNNDFYGGSLSGIRKKLPYLEQLGVNILYLNPIFMAYSNHRYDTADYLTIDPLLGTEEDFRLLCEDVHRRGMKIILDGVFSHTGSDSIYFDKENRFGNGACHNPDSPYRKWFDFQDYPHKYTSWWGIETLPCVMEENPSYMDYIIYGEDSVVAHWLNCGADGFRLDVADELPDTFIRALTKRVKEIKPDGIVIGEVWEDASNKISYGCRRTYFCHETGPELDSVMNYPFRNAILDAVLGKITPKEFEHCIMTIAEHYPKPILQHLMNSLSTHDTPRILSLLGKEGETLSRSEKAVFRMEDAALQQALQKEKMAVLLQFFLPGIPCIYYGDEVGMEGFEDPFNRGFHLWEKGDKELTAFYREMAQLHQRLSASAEITFVDAGQCICFERGDLMILCNPAPCPCEIPMNLQEVLWAQNAEYDGKLITLNPFGCALLKKR